MKYISIIFTHLSKYYYKSTLIISLISIFIITSLLCLFSYKYGREQAKAIQAETAAKEIPNLQDSKILFDPVSKTLFLHGQHFTVFYEVDTVNNSLFNKKIPFTPVFYNSDN